MRRSSGWPTAASSSAATPTSLPSTRTRASPPPTSTSGSHGSTRGNLAVREFLLYPDGLVARRRAAPGDPEIDVLSRLIAGEGGEALSAPELLHNCIFLLNAGHETTTNLIGNGLAALLDWPDEKA